MTASTSRFRVANAPCSWGALEFDVAGPQPAWQRVLDEMRRAGYAGTELGDWGFMPAEPAGLRAALEPRGLALVGGFVPVALARAEAHAEGVARAVRTAELMASVAVDPVLVLADDNGADAVRTRLAGRIRPEHRLDDGAWAVLASGAEAVARAVRERTGLDTAFHHHCAGWVETPDEIDRLLELTDPELVGLCLDTGHVTYGGGDAALVARRHAARIRHVHFKDCDPAVAGAARREELGYFDAVRRGVFCELGRGSVDFASILATLRERDYQGWIVVEQDVFPGLGDPLRSAEQSRAYLDRLGI